MEKVLTGYPAYYGGMKVHDFLISVNGQEVFELNHAQLVNLIKTSGNSMQVAVERQVASCVLWKGFLVSKTFPETKKTYTLFGKIPR